MEHGTAAASSCVFPPSTDWRNGSASAMKVTRSNRVSVTLSLVRGVAERYTHRHGFHKVMKAVDEVVDDKIAYFARSCNYTYNLGY